MMDPGSFSERDTYFIINAEAQVTGIVSTGRNPQSKHLLLNILQRLSH
jgi:hypothetical protein